MEDPVLFNMKLERELRDAFMEAVKARDQTAAQVVRSLMKAYIDTPTTKVRVITEQVS
jgi:uncharacterized protein YqeY